MEFVFVKKYCKDLAKHLRTENTSDKPTPMSTSICLDKNENGKKVDQKLHRSMTSLYFI